MFWSTTRRRKAVFAIGRFEALETRALLSAAVPDLCEQTPVAAEIGALVPGEATARAKADGPLTGQWTIETTAGDVEITSVQKGNKVKGTATVPGLPGQTINFKGTVDAEGEVNIRFSGKVKDVELGKVKYEGEVQAQIVLANVLISGVIKVEVNGETVIDQSFESDLPTPPLGSTGLSMAAIRKAKPRIQDYSGDYPSSGSLGDGTLNVFQDGLYVQGTFDTNATESAIFDAVFINNRSNKAKGVIQIEFSDEPGVTWGGKFWVKFFGGDSWSSSYGKLFQVTND